MKLKTFIELGRSSNLPTVWTNVLAGAALMGVPSLRGGSWHGVLWLTLAAICATLFYLGGMLLNDAFDADWDSKHRPDRPIPAGRASQQEVFLYGFGLLGLGITGLALRTVLGEGGMEAVLAGLFTCAAIVAYDRFHKGVAWAPVMMGACRAGVYGVGAFSVAASPTPELLFCAGALWAYIIGLTHVARFETSHAVTKLWIGALVFAPAGASAVLVFRGGISGTTTAVSLAVAWLVHIIWSLRALRIVTSKQPKAIPRAVVSLIAGVCLVDAQFLAAADSPWLALAAALSFLLTLRWQRFVAGT